MKVKKDVYGKNWRSRHCIGLKTFVINKKWGKAI
jgi:hypothetical protein